MMKLPLSWACIIPVFCAQSRKAFSVDIIIPSVYSFFK